MGCSEQCQISILFQLVSHPSASFYISSNTSVVHGICSLCVRNLRKMGFDRLISRVCANRVNLLVKKENGDARAAPS